MSKYRFKNSSIYIGDSDLPHNKLSITDPLELHAIENELLIQAYELFYHSIDEDTVFDEKYFISLHKATFTSLYEWAGEYRTLNMSKGDSRFCLALHLHDASKKILTRFHVITIFVEAMSALKSNLPKNYPTTNAS
jgi:cell filamentation protein